MQIWEVYVSLEKGQRSLHISTNGLEVEKH